MDPQTGRPLVCIDCWIEKENRAGLMFMARRPPYKDFMYYNCASCLEKMGTPSYTTRADATGEKSSTTDPGGYVIGLGIKHSTRVGAKVASGDDKSQSSTKEPASQLPK